MARKTSLREFQRNVAERLRDPSKLRAFASKLGFQVGDENWIVSLADVAEVIPVPMFVPVPQTKAWFCGVANIRGRLFSIADFAAFQGKPAAATGLERRVVLLNERLLEASGIVVSRMLGLRNPESLVQESVDDPGRPWIKAQFLEPSGERWLELDIPSLARDASFVDVSAAAAAIADSPSTKGQ
jgi:twitching motility protein PilI